MTNLVKIAKSVAVKSNRNSVKNYLLIGDKLKAELTTSILNPTKEEVSNSIAFMEEEYTQYSVAMQQDSMLTSALPFICIPIVILVREYEIPIQDLYYGFMAGGVLAIMVRAILNIQRQSVSFYALGALKQLANRNLRG